MQADGAANFLYARMALGKAGEWGLAAITSAAASSSVTKCCESLQVEQCAALWEAGRWRKRKLEPRLKLLMSLDE